MDSAVRKLLSAREFELRAAKRRVLMAAPNWAVDVPLEAGVYAVWENDEPIYIGETSSLRARMSDLGRPVNHTFARKTCKSFQIAETSLEELAAAMRAKYVLSFVRVPFGRAEVEEFMILRWRTTLINKPAKRLLRSSQYAWVQAV
jgi:hypothetical protein